MANLAHHLALVGHPVSHSRSPSLHAAALTSVGLEGDYTLVDAPDAAAFDAALGRLVNGQLRGLNVTVPHKLLAADRCDVVTDVAKAVGAVNTLWVEGGLVHGDNTDVAGLREATSPLLQERLETSVQTAAVVGAGGAARAAVLAARQLGARTVRVVNRTRTRAEALVQALGAGVTVADTLETALEGVDLVYQATTQGMGWAPDSERYRALQERARQVLSRCAQQAVLVDLVYVPRITPWVAAARSVRLPADDGLEMLVRQAATAFTRWTGRQPDVEAMRAAVT